MDVVKMAVTFKIFNEIDEMLNRYAESTRSSQKRTREVGNVSVSVIVPTRNEARNIKRLLASLRLFHYRNFEL